MNAPSARRTAPSSQSRARAHRRARRASASKRPVTAYGHPVTGYCSLALAATRLPTFLGGATALRVGHAPAAGVGLPAPRAAALVTASRLLVHRRPRAALGFVLPGAFRLVALLDVALHPLLLVRVLVLVATRHLTPPMNGTSRVQTQFR